MHEHCYGDDQMHYYFEQARTALPTLLDEIERLEELGRAATKKIELTYQELALWKVALELICDHQPFGPAYTPGCMPAYILELARAEIEKEGKQ